MISKPYFAEAAAVLRIKLADNPVTMGSNETPEILCRGDECKRLAVIPPKGRILALLGS